MFEKAMVTEMDGLVRRGTFELIARSTVEPFAKILSERFVLERKESETATPLHKARPVVQVHRDKNNDMLVHNSSTACPASVVSAHGHLWNAQVRTVAIRRDTSVHANRGGAHTSCVYPPTP